METRSLPSPPQPPRSSHLPPNPLLWFPPPPLSPPSPPPLLSNQLSPTSKPKPNTHSTSASLALPPDIDWNETESNTTDGFSGSSGFLQTLPFYSAVDPLHHACSPDSTKAVDPLHHGRRSNTVDLLMMNRWKEGGDREKKRRREGSPSRRKKEERRREMQEKREVKREKKEKRE